MLLLMLFLMHPALRLNFGWKTLSFSLNVVFIPSLGFTGRTCSEREITQQYRGCYEFNDPVLIDDIKYR